jgi:cytoskeletal protein CcmA (bactofilin family)
MRIDGNVIGNIEIDGVLNLSDTGCIDGDILAVSARVAGRVLGNIQCKAALHLASSAQVMGDITTEALIVDNGAVFHGKCQTNAMLSGSPTLAYTPA